MLTRYDFPDFCNTDDLKRCYTFAFDAHAEVKQVRKYTGDPYIVHPVAVARMISKVSGCTPDMLMAALLHDVIEDTNRTREDIVLNFGIEVADMVEALSDMETGNRKERKAKALIRLSNSDWRVQTIKCADIMHNAAPIRIHDKNFAPLFMRETFALITAMDKADENLRSLSLDLVSKELKH